MRKTISLLVLGLMLHWAAAAQHNREKYSMNFNCKFYPADLGNGEFPGLDDDEWRTLDLPHDWSVERPFDREAPAGGRGGYLPGGISWYRKTFDFQDSWEGKTVWIDFDGIYMNSDVWINGHHLGNHPYGYTGFHYDVSPYLVQGENILAVRVDNSLQPNSRWYSGSGIYRQVWLTVSDPLHIGHWGVFISTPDVSENAARVKIRTRIENSRNISVHAILRSSILDPGGECHWQPEYSIFPGRGQHR